MASKKEQEEIYHLVTEIGKFFGSRCYICHEACRHGKGFTVHHLQYSPREKTYKDFARRLDYLRYLYTLLKHHRSSRKTKRFIHNRHHIIVSNLRLFKDDMVIKRICKMVLETERRHSKTLHSST